MVKKGSTSEQNKAKSGRQKSGGAGRDIVWANPRPNSRDLIWLEGDPNNLVADFLSLCEEMHEEERLSCKLDEHSSRWSAILFDYRSEPPEPVRALSVRASTALDALFLLAYFAVRHEEGNWREAVGEDTGRFG